METNEFKLHLEIFHALSACWSDFTENEADSEFALAATSVRWVNMFNEPFQENVIFSLLLS